MGGRPPDVSDSEILEVFTQLEDPALFTRDVTDKLSIGRQGTYQRLNELYERDLINKKQNGNCIVWWISGSGEEYLKNSS